MFLYDNLLKLTRADEPTEWAIVGNYKTPVTTLHFRRSSPEEGGPSYLCFNAPILDPDALPTAPDMELTIRSDENLSSQEIISALVVPFVYGEKGHTTYHGVSESFGPNDIDQLAIALMGANPPNQKLPKLYLHPQGVVIVAAVPSGKTEPLWWVSTVRYADMTPLAASNLVPRVSITEIESPKLSIYINRLSQKEDDSSEKDDRAAVVQQARDFAWGYSYAYAGARDISVALKEVLDELFDLTDEETAVIIEES